MNLYDLPDVLLDIIFECYWKDRYKAVIVEFNNIYLLEGKIKNFLKTYCFRENFFDAIYLTYLRNFNTEIQTIVKKKVYKFIFKNRNLYIQYCFDDDNIFNNIHHSLQYICCLSVNISGFMRYNTFYKFQELSICKPVKHNFIGSG